MLTCYIVRYLYWPTFIAIWLQLQKRTKVTTYNG